MIIDFNFFYIVIVIFSLKIILDIYTFRYLRKKRIKKTMIENARGKKKKDMSKAKLWKTKELKKEKLTRFELIITIVNIIFILTVSAVWSTFDPLSPKPNTEVMLNGSNCRLLTIEGSFNAHWRITIKNSGNGEAEGVGLEVEFPDDSEIILNEKLFVDWKGNWSRKPDYYYSVDNYCIVKWNFLPAKCEMRIDLQLILSKKASNDDIYPNRVVVFAKEESSPIYEYP